MDLEEVLLWIPHGLKFLVYKGTCGGREWERPSEAGVSPESWPVGQKRATVTCLQVQDRLVHDLLASPDGHE